MNNKDSVSTSKFKAGNVWKALMILFIITFSLLSICLVRADTQNDIIPAKAVSIVNEYEKAYMNKDLDKMIEYVDQSSDWFKKGFVEEFRAIFENFTIIRLYHFNKRIVWYVADGVEVVQNTIFIAYNPTISDVNEIGESYYLKKVGGEYKIAECAHLPAADVDFVDKGTSASLQGKAEEAATYFKKAIESNPENSAAHCRLGMVYAKTKRPQESIQELKKAVELRPKIGFYRFLLSQVHYMLGDKEKAAEEMEKAVMLDSGLEMLFSKQ